MDFELSVDLILARLLDSFAHFVHNYGMDNIISTIPELIDMLKIDEGKMAKKKGKESALKETCFYYGQVGQWKRNYKAYLESKKKVACDAPSSSSIYVIKVNTVSPKNIWVYNTSYGSCIWIDMKGQRISRKITKGEFDFRVGNGARVAASALWTYVLNLPSDICLNLEDCCYVLALTNNIIYVSCLNKKGIYLYFVTMVVTL